MTASTLHGELTKRVGTLIVNGADGYAPGDRINLDTIATEAGATRTTAHAAFSQLAACGLVTVTRGRTGTVVRPISDWHLTSPNVAAWLAEGPDRYSLTTQRRQFAELLQEHPLAENRFWLAALTATAGPP